MIPEQLIINFDQFGCNLVPTGHSTMEEKGVKQVKITKSDDKREVTIVLSTTLSGDVLPFQVRLFIFCQYQVSYIFRRLYIKEKPKIHILA